MSEGAFLICILILCCIMVYFELQHKKERKDLLNRLMAKDYQEYLNAINKTGPTPGRNFITRYQKETKPLHSEAGD